MRRCKTIVATALPTIVADLQGGNNYSWVGRYVPFRVISTFKACAPLG